MDDGTEDTHLSDMESIPLTQNIQKDLLSSPTGNGADIRMQHVERVAKQAIDVHGWVISVFLSLNNKYGGCIKFIITYDHVTMDTVTR